MTSLRDTKGSAGGLVRNRRSSGYTLVEMLAVVAVLTILLGTAGVPATGDGNAALDLAEVRLRDAFRYAQDLSYSLGEPHGVVFDLLEHRFAVVGADGVAVPNPLTHAAYVVEHRGDGQLGGIFIGLANFGSTGHAGIFDAQGVPVEGGVVTLGKGVLTRSYAFDGATGKLSAL